MNETVKLIFWNEAELRAGFRLVLYFLMVYALFRVVPFVRTTLHLPRFTSGEIAPLPLLVQELLSLLVAALPALVLARLEGRSFGAYGFPVADAFRRRFWQGIAWGFAMILAMIFLIRALGGLSFGGLALGGVAIWTYALRWAIVFLAVGFFEEFLFRGYMLYTLSTGLGFWPAATILSALFGAGHLGNPGEGRVGALSVVVIGMFLSLTVRRTGNLWFAVGLHAAFDWGETYFYSVPDSGLSAVGHLLTTTFHGPAWLTGGTVGPEGSAAAFVVMGLSALIFSRYYPAREDQMQSSF